jgi:hypothetical protein
MTNQLGYLAEIGTTHINDKSALNNISYQLKLSIAGQFMVKNTNIRYRDGFTSHGCIQPTTQT